MWTGRHNSGRWNLDPEATFLLRRYEDQYNRSQYQKLPASQVITTKGPKNESLRPEELSLSGYAVEFIYENGV